MDALIGMAVVLTALLAVFILMLVFLLAWLMNAKKSADAGIAQVNESKDLNRQAMELSRKNIELQTETNAAMRELIEALRARQ